MGNCHSSRCTHPASNQPSPRQRAISLKARMLNMKVRRELSNPGRSRNAEPLKTFGLSTADLILHYLQEQMKFTMYEHEYYPNIALYFEHANRKDDQNPESQQEIKETLTKLKKSSIMKERSVKNSDPVIIVNKVKDKTQKPKRNISLSQEIAEIQQKVQIERQIGDSDSLRFHLGKLGELCWRNGEYNRSIIYLEEGLRVCNRLHRQDSLEAAFFHSNLGINYEKLKQSEQAFKNFQIALKINRNHKGENSLGVAAAYNNIGNIFKSKGRYEKALQYYSKSLRIKLKLFGGKGEGVAASLSNIALLEWEKKSYPQAVEKYKEALAIYKQAYGPAHFQISRTLFNLALCYYDMREHSLWLENHFQSLRILQELKLTQHPSYTKRKDVFAANLYDVITGPQCKSEFVQRALEMAFLIFQPDETIIRSLQQRLKSFK